MSGAATPARDHAALMDSLYRGQRHIYDATRKYFLFGRDTLIEGLHCRAGATVLEIGCGTGRNLAQIAHRWPGARLHGLDLSGEMLKSADRKLGGKTALALGDATDFSAPALFGREGFDRAILSYALSMIPDWKAAIEQGVAVLAPGGSLHIVDFGDLTGLYGPLRKGLEAWLAHFHVTPRGDLAEFAIGVAAQHGLTATTRRGRFGYFRLVTITRKD